MNMDPTAAAAADAPLNLSVDERNRRLKPAILKLAELAAPTVKTPAGVADCDQGATAIRRSLKDYGIDVALAPSTADVRAAVIVATHVVLQAVVAMATRCVHDTVEEQRACTVGTARRIAAGALTACGVQLVVHPH